MYDTYNNINGINKLKNRLQLVRNIKKMGTTASTYYWSKTLCKPG